jgi:hypothetical protein
MYSEDGQYSSSVVGARAVEKIINIFTASDDGVVVRLTLSQEVPNLVAVEVAHRDMVHRRSIVLCCRCWTCSFAFASPSIACRRRWGLLSCTFSRGGICAGVAVLVLTVPLSWSPPAIRIISTVP